MASIIPFYITDQGLLLRIETGNPHKIQLNDKPLHATFHPQWWTVEAETEIRSYSVHAGTRPANERYVLVNPTVSGVEPLIRREDVERDEDGNWSGKHAGLDTLYRYEKDDEDLGFVAQPFEAKHLGSVTLAALGDPTVFSYKMHKVGYEGSEGALGYKDIFQQHIWLAEKIEVDDIAKAMTPDVAWHLYPCSVSSSIAYRIIRSHVKDNIDPRFAAVTSDYDFCFTVKKKIRVVPYVRKWEVHTANGRSYRPPRFNRKTVEYETHEVFEMTHAKDAYRGYTVVEGFNGESLQGLAQNIDRYLSELMEVINAPLTRCQHCDGRGVTDYFKLPTNERLQFGITAA